MAKDSKPTKGPVPTVENVDVSILTADEIAELELLAEQNVTKAAKAAAKAVMLKQLEAKLRQKAGLSEQAYNVTVDVAPYADRIVLDGVTYLQGGTYEVRQNVAFGMLEIMAMTWNHQAEIDGKDENLYRRGSGTVISPANPNGGNILRA